MRVAAKERTSLLGVGKEFCKQRILSGKALPDGRDELVGSRLGKERDDVVKRRPKLGSFVCISCLEDLTDDRSDA